MKSDNKAKIIEELRRQMNFSEPEATAYFLLLKQDLSASTLAQQLQINRSYVYGLLKKLISLGFCLEISDTVRKYRAIEPVVAFEGEIEDLNSRIDGIKKLTMTLTPIYESRIQEASNEMIKVLHSKAHIIDTIERYESEAHTEVLAFSKPPYLMDYSNPEVTCRAQDASLRQGVRHRTIYELEKGNEDHLRVLRHSMNNGEEVRVVDFLPMKFVIFDHQRIIFTLGKQPGKQNDTSFTFLDDTNLAQTISMIFEMYWENASTYNEYIQSVSNTQSENKEGKQ